MIKKTSTQLTFPDDSLGSEIFRGNITSSKVLNWLNEIYDQVDWRSLLLDKKIPNKYNGISTIKYFKVFALPYLVNISPSERYLGQLIIKNTALQRLCGFQYDEIVSQQKNVEVRKGVFSKRSLWHFRNNNKEMFSEMMVKTLILLVLNGESPMFGLPYVSLLKKHEFPEGMCLTEWKIDEYRHPINIYLPEIQESRANNYGQKEFAAWRMKWREEFISCSTYEEYISLEKKFREEQKYFGRSVKKGFSKEITFPIDVNIKLIDDSQIFFRLLKPDFLVPSNAYQKKLEGYSNTYILKNNYDKACNVLVIRETERGKEILLSRRKSKSHGTGMFAVPGGKQKDGETLENCAIRELEEETGLLMKESKPVSIFYTRTDKQVMSVGVLAENWEGDPKTREPDKHEKWEWYGINDLPTPIFEHSFRAIVQFREGKYPNLTWSDFEEKPSSQLELDLDQ